MVTPQPINKGIIDHDLKLEIVAALLGIRNKHIEIAKKFSHILSHGQTHRDLAGNIRNYSRGHNPTGSVGSMYLEGVCAFLVQHGFINTNLRDKFVTHSFEEFALSVPRRLISQNRRIGALVQPIIDRQGIPPTYSIPSKQPIDIEQMFERQHIDQLIIYESEKAARAWNAVLQNRNYKQYGHCEEALSKLLASDEWKNFVKTSQPDGFVKLGAGSPSKDLMIIESMASILKADQAITASIIDYSQPMIDLSNAELCSMLDKSVLSLYDKVILKPVKTNFLDLKPIDCIRRPGVPIAFFITGGTIGNLNEAEFLSSIKRVAEPGDKLIVCAETIPEDIQSNEEFDKYENYLLEKYQHTDAQDMLAPALEKIWFLLEHSERYEEAKRTSIVPKIVRGRRDGITSIAKSISVVFEVVGGLKPIRLIASTRYNLSRLIEFVEEDGFLLDSTFHSSENQQFVATSFTLL